MSKWTGFLIDERAEMICKLIGEYATSEAVRNNAGRCYFEQTGCPDDMTRAVVVSVESEDGENIDEVIELTARDLIENTYGVTQGYRIGPDIVVAPPEPDAIERALNGAKLGRTGRALMDAIADEGHDDPEVIAAEFAAFIEKMAA